jgi:uncharacterized membrane-anchored protein YhcB (DUF1043 family)
MSLMFIRVLAGFLAGLAAGILLMRVTYKKAETHKEDETASLTTSTSASN